MITYTWDKMSAVHKEILAVVNETLMTDDERFTADRFYPGEFGADAAKRLEFRTLADEGYFFYFEVSDTFKFTHEGLVALNGRANLANVTAAPPAPVYTVQCRCGYMASEHDTEGNCPGDGYELGRMRQPDGAVAERGEDARTDLDDDTLVRWPRMFRDRATQPEWKDWYNDHARNDILDLLDVVATLKAHNARLQAELAAARGALNPGMYTDLNHLADMLDKISVASWESWAAGALGFTIGLLRRAQAATADTRAPGAGATEGE